MDLMTQGHDLKGSRRINTQTSAWWFRFTPGLGGGGLARVLGSYLDAEPCGLL